MKKTTIAFTVLATFAAGIALAHSGATGIVKERMDGMAAMQKVTKAVTPIMRGTVTYDAEAVRAYAKTVEQHSGEAMTKLFPEGSGGMPSEAKDTVWSDWEEFEALAMRLETLGQALDQAADNGLVAGNGTAGASMMGTGGMMGDQMATGGMMGLSSGSMMDLDMLGEMPADAVFTQISQTCSACHTKYRAESN